MAKLASRKTRLECEFSDVVREQGKLREVIMEITPYLITVRLKGLRQRYEVSPAGVYNHAVIAAVEKQRAAKKAKTASSRRK
jgi:hypothetical protein